MNPQLNFLYLHNNHIGYGVHGAATAKALSAVGIDVYDGLPGSGDLDIANKRAKVCKDVLTLTIPTHVNGWWKGQRSHLFTMWEANDIPDEMKATLHNFDTILTPSDSCVEMYRKYHDNVHFVPLGVDGDRWHFQARRTDDIFFNFLIGGSGVRKGNDLVHRAFLELFGSGFDPGDRPIPRLLMKDPKGEQREGHNVVVIGGWMPPEDEVALYASAHCYVQPSRGEGWGMQPLQAMAQGCPTILTDAHGHSAFAQYGIPIKATTTQATYMNMFGQSGDWWEPDYEQLKREMKHVYDRYDWHQDAAAKRSELVRKRFTWEHSAERIVEVLGRDKLNERFRSDEIPTEWFTPDAKLFRVITRRDWKADIAGVTHLLRKGVTYWKNADVKRVLFEGGVLDPECVADGDGLTTAQLEHLGEYIDDYSSCPTCFRPYDKEQEVG